MNPSRLDIFADMRLSTKNTQTRFDQWHPPRLTGEQQAELSRLADDVKRIWHHPSASMILKKQIVRTLIVEIVVDLEKPKNEVVLIIHWAGGHHTELRAPTHWRKRQSYVSARLGQWWAVGGEGAGRGRPLAAL
jgi:hypothetical protein